MALLLETTWGDLVIDLDVEGSPALCRNILKLAKCRYYTSTLVYNVQPNRFCQLGDPRGDGTGGGCIHGLLDGKNEDIISSKARFLKSRGRTLTSKECTERGRVVATEMNGIPDTIGSQFLITLEEGEGRALDGYIPPHHGEEANTTAPRYLSLGIVAEDDDNVLEKIHNAYCDANGRPYADIRVERALVLHDPFEDPPGMKELMERRGVVFDSQDNVTCSPSYERPPEERIEIRIPANQVEEEEEDEQDPERARQREEEVKKKEDTSRAVVLEMLGDLPSADIKAPEEVLFVCKLNPITEDEDLELIFSRFDPNVKVEIIRDPATGVSLQYAFVEFSTKKQCVEAYFKMNGALIDDRRIKVDFSQSVAKIWDKYNQRMRTGGAGHGRPPSANRGRGGGRNFNRPQHGGLGQRHHDHHDGLQREDQGRYGPPGNDDERNRENRERFGQHHPPGDDHRRHYSSRSYEANRDERHHHRDDSSPRSELDGYGRRRRTRSRSISPDYRSRDRKRGKHSKKRHRHERSHEDEAKRKRHHDDDGHSSRRHDSSDEDRRSGQGEGSDSHRRHRDGDQGQPRHRKYHRHHRDEGDKRRDEGKHRDDHRHRKRKHKERERRSRSRSGSYEDK